MKTGRRGRGAEGIAALALALACAYGPPVRAADPALEHVPHDACLDALLHATSVSVEFYDRTGKASWGGDAVSRVDQRNRFTYTYRWFERGDSVEVVIDAKASLEIIPHHTVHLPRGLNDSTARYRRLRLHEFDHVAVASDERLQLLARWLVANMPPVIRRVPRGTPVGSGLANQAIGEAIEQRYRAMVTLMQAQETLLDSLTSHGTAPIPGRSAFFDGLYTREGLERAHFAYLPDVEPLLATPRYRNAPRPRCDDTP